MIRILIAVTALILCVDARIVEAQPGSGRVRARQLRTRASSPNALQERANRYRLLGHDVARGRLGGSVGERFERAGLLARAAAAEMASSRDLQNAERLDVLSRAAADYARAGEILAEGSASAATAESPADTARLRRRSASEYTRAAQLYDRLAAIAAYERLEELALESQRKGTTARLRAAVAVEDTNPEQHRALAVSAMNAAARLEQASRGRNPEIYEFARLTIQNVIVALNERRPGL